MDRLHTSISIQMNEKLYNKDPETSVLGKKIIQHSIEMIHETGIEVFTFKKLGIRIQSNESSIYRYFENKHKLLLYITSWYWSWVEYQLVFKTINVDDPYKRMEKAIDVLIQPVRKDLTYNHIDEVLLSEIVINEFSKSYLTKEVDRENKEGYFLVFKRLITRLKEMIVEMNPSYPFPSSLASTIIEAALYQGFLKDHFPSITDCTSAEDIQQFLMHLIQTSLKK